MDIEMYDVPCCRNEVLASRAQVALEDEEEVHTSRAQVTVVCDLCDNPKNIKYYCTKCDASICEDCKDRHQRKPVFKDHMVRDRIDVMAPIGSMCRHHASKEIITKCTTCCVAVCQKCIQESHVGHAFDSLKLDKKSSGGCTIL